MSTSQASSLSPTTVNQSNTEQQEDDSPQEITTPPTPRSTTRKRKSTAQSGTAKKRKINKEESLIICEAYKYHKGNWRRILSDENIKKLGRDEKQLKNHIDYQKRRKNEAISPPQVATAVRNNIVADIHDQLETTDNNTLVNEYVNDDEEFVENPSLDPNNTPDSPRLQLLHDIHTEELSDSVLSSDINTSQDYDNIAHKLKDKQAIRNERIREKDKIHRLAVNDIRQQQKDRVEANNTNNMFMMMMMQMEERRQEREERRQEMEERRQEREERRLENAEKREELFSQQQQQFQLQIIEQMRLSAQQQQASNLIMMEFLRKFSGDKQDAL